MCPLKRLTAICLLILTALSSGCTSIRRSDTVDFWRFEMHATPHHGVSDLSYQWPGMAVLSYFGNSPRQLCGAVGSAASIDLILVDAPLVIVWSDEQKVKHVVRLNLKRLVGHKTLYGGTLTLEFNDSNVNVYLSEPDKSKEGPRWPRKAPVLLASES